MCKSKPCSTPFSQDHYEGVRLQCREPSRDELDIVLLGQISALLSNDQDTNAPNPLPRQRSSMAFYHGGQICRKIFQKIHGKSKGSTTLSHTYMLTSSYTHRHTYVYTVYTNVHAHAHVHTHMHTHTRTCTHIPIPSNPLACTCRCAHTHTALGLGM